MTNPGPRDASRALIQADRLCDLLDGDPLSTQAERDSADSAWAKAKADYDAAFAPYRKG